MLNYASTSSCTLSCSCYYFQGRNTSDDTHVSLFLCLIELRNVAPAENGSGNLFILMLPLWPGVMKFLSELIHIKRKLAMLRELESGLRENILIKYCHWEGNKNELIELSCWMPIVNQNNFPKSQPLLRGGDAAGNFPGETFPLSAYFPQH